MRRANIRYVPITKAGSSTMEKMLQVIEKYLKNETINEFDSKLNSMFTDLGI